MIPHDSPLPGAFGAPCLKFCIIVMQSMVTCPQVAILQPIKCLQSEEPRDTMDLLGPWLQQNSVSPLLYPRDFKNLWFLKERATFWPKSQLHNGNYPFGGYNYRSGYG